MHSEKKKKNEKEYFGGRNNMADVSIGVGLIAIGASIAFGLSAIATAIAEKSIGTAAVGALAEKEELFGKVLILTVIPETIVLFGIVALIMLVGLVG